MKKKLLSMLLAFTLTAGILTGCGSASDMSNKSESAMAVTTSDYYDGGENGVAYDESAMEEEYENEEMADSDANSDFSKSENNENVKLLEEKLVYHCDLNIETLEYDKSMASIKETIKKYKGVIQSESESDDGDNWYYSDYQKTRGTLHDYLEVRIPSANYSDFVAELNGVGKIVSKNTSVDNISQKYYDTTAQIEALKLQEKNLLVMMEKCETIEDMITVEKRLSEVQYELSNLTTEKRYMDMDVAYSYVNISIKEVMEYKVEKEPVKTNTFIDRLKNVLEDTGLGFLSFLEGLLFVIIALLPYIIIVLIVCFFFRKKIKRAVDNAKAEKEARRVQTEMRRQQIMQQAAYMNGQTQNNQMQNDQQQDNSQKTENN